MNCPYCGAPDTKILETRVAAEAAAVRRRRRCAACGAAHYTMERLDTSPLIVLTRDGKREDFDRARVVDSLAVAGAASLPSQRREEIAEVVIARLHDAGPVVSSHEIGNLVLEVLSKHDVATFIRYAIAVKRPVDLCELTSWLSEQLGAAASSVDLVVTKEDGQHEIFDLGRVRDSLRHATKGRRGVTEGLLHEWADQVAEQVRATSDAPPDGEPVAVLSRAVADAILDRLLDFDPVAYLHYAVTVKQLGTYPRLLGELDHINRVSQAAHSLTGGDHA